MKDMSTEIKKEKDEEIKQLTIVGEPSFCMKALVAKKVDPKEKI